MDARRKFLNNFSRICEELGSEISIYCAFDLNTTFGITFSELNQISEDLSNYFLKFFDNDTCYVAVEVAENFFLPCLILGIWKSERAFMGIGSQYSSNVVLNCLNVLGVKFLITDKDKCDFSKDDSHIVSIFYIQQSKFYLLQRKVKEENKERLPEQREICYGIMTSGSTGRPKVIQVPWSCILLNFEELMEVFCVTKSDCIFQFSPCTFDPFFIELFFALLNGCSLIIVLNAIKLSPSDLLQILFYEDNNNEYYIKKKSACSDISVSNCFFIDGDYVKRKPITILQMTPSMFLKWNDNDINHIILSPKTCLKYLILGGEKFPVKILQMKHSNNKTKIFNIYGITEISCWAFINEINNEGSPKKCISLGKPLKHITYQLTNKSELLIGSSTRICFVNSPDDDIFTEKNDFKDMVFRRTGDIVQVEQNEIYYMSRSNQIIKRLGIKINLEEIQEAFLSINPHFSACVCIFDEPTMKLALFYVVNTSRNIHFRLQPLENFIQNGNLYPYKKLRDIDKPDFLVEISKVPLNSHGKCDLPKLHEHLQEIQNSSQHEKIDLKTNFHIIWKEILGLKNYNSNSKSFLEMGGNSVLALQMISKLEDLGLKVSKNLIVKILNGESEEKCLKYLLDTITNEVLPPPQRLELGNNSIKLSIKWKFDVGKCIDATPCCFQYQGCEKLAIGSHSFKLYCIASDHGEEIWKVRLDDRIESGVAVTMDGSRGFVGCYDKFVYCLSMVVGTIIWKFKTEDIIKSTPCLSRNEKTVFVASYDKCLYCLSVEDGCLLKRLIISEKGIYSSGIIGSVQFDLFFLASLDGTCVALNQSSLELKWKRKLESPVFASPCLLNEDKVIFIEVMGLIHCFSASEGLTVWTYSVNGLIYSTPVCCSSENIINLIFGCHDSNLYCLKVTDKPQLKWKQAMDSSVFSRPCLFNCFGEDRLMVCAATTKGIIYLCNYSTGEIYATTKLDGEVFSSPVVRERQFYVGSRDNNLYALNVSISE